MKSLLLGSGHSRTKQVVWGDSEVFTDLTTVDLFNADINHDLNVLPYPFEDGSFDEIHAYEVLEHLGTQGDFRFFFAQFNEFYRILRSGGAFCGSVPLPGSVWAFGDPGHTRVLPREVFSFLTEEHYEQLGKTPSADYRAFINGFWQVHCQEKGQKLYFLCQKST